MNEVEVNRRGKPANQVVPRHRIVQREAEVQLQLDSLHAHHGRHLRLRRELDHEANLIVSRVAEFGNNPELVTIRERPHASAVSASMHCGYFSGGPTFNALGGPCS